MSETPPTDWAGLVRDYMVFRGWTQQQAADEWRVSRRTVGYWLNGTTLPLSVVRRAIEREIKDAA